MDSRRVPVSPADTDGEDDSLRLIRFYGQYLIGKLDEQGIGYKHMATNTDQAGIDRYLTPQKHATSSPFGKKQHNQKTGAASNSSHKECIQHTKLTKRYNTKPDPYPLAVEPENRLLTHSNSHLRNSNSKGIDQKRAASRERLDQSREYNRKLYERIQQIRSQLDLSTNQGKPREPNSLNPQEKQVLVQRFIRRMDEDRYRRAEYHTQNTIENLRVADRSISPQRVDIAGRANEISINATDELIRKHMRKMYTVFKRASNTSTFRENDRSNSKKKPSPLKF